MHSPSFHLPQFWERGETDPCPRPRAPVIDLLSAKRERSQPGHATATGMIKLRVRARANPAPLGERRMRQCDAWGRCPPAGAMQKHCFTLNWRRDGMVRFALLVSRTFCHCSRLGGSGQGRCRRLPVPPRKTLGLRRGGLTDRPQPERCKSTNLPGQLAVGRMPGSSDACWQRAPTGHGRRMSARANAVSRTELAPAPRQIARKAPAGKTAGLLAYVPRTKPAPRKPPLQRRAGLPTLLALAGVMRRAIQALEKR